MSDDLDLHAPAFYADPYPFFHRLRDTDPIHWNQPGVWLSTRYADVMPLLRDPRIGHPPGRTPEYIEYLLQHGELSPIDFVFSHWMLSRNPPDHTRLRGLVSKAFTPSVLDNLRPRIQAIFDSLLAEAEKRTTFDIIEDLAYPLPVIVIAELLGVPAEDRHRFREWSRNFVGIFDINPPADALSRGTVAVQTFIDYFKTLIAARRSQPQNDLLSTLITLEDEHGRLSENELIANCILLFVAGHETTMNLIGNGMLALLGNPDQFAMLHSDPSLIGHAVEELLRYDSPVQFFGRYILEDVAIGGKMLRRGQTIFIMPGAINRDPAQFPDPDRLDITRGENKHYAFGYGIHFCLGAPLARVEGQVAIGTLARRMPNLALHEDGVVRRNTHTVRGLKALPVSC